MKLTIGTEPAVRDAGLRANLIEEEVGETCKAIREGDLVETIDGLCDTLYVTYGSGVAFGVDLVPMLVERLLGDRHGLFPGEIMKVAEDLISKRATSTHWMTDPVEVLNENRRQTGDGRAPDFSFGPFLRDGHAHELSFWMDQTVKGLRGDSPDLVSSCILLCELLRSCLIAGAEFGIDLNLYFDEVQKSNMAKVGGPVREDGKILKPPGWKPPQIREMMVERGWVP
jgi:predicted HAD superfamily Cof-like phosphohydrolase